MMYSKPEEALAYVQKGLALAEEKNYTRGISLTMNRMGSVYRILGKYAKSLEAHLGAYQIAEENGDKDGMARALNNTGILYSEQNDSHKAIDYFLRTKKLAEELKNDVLLEISYSNLGTDYAKMEELDSALYYTRKAYDVVLKQDESSSNFLLLVLANIYYRMKDYRVAMDFYRKSIPLSLAANDKLSLSLTYAEMAEVFKAIQSPDSAEIYALKSLELAREVNNPKTIYEASSILAELYDTQNPALAYRYYKEATEAKNEMFNQEKVRQLQNLSFQEQLRVAQIERERIEYKNRVGYYALLAGVLVSLIIALLLFRLSRNRKRANDELTRQKEELEDTLAELRTTQDQLVQSEKMASLGELTAGIAHEIQNPLNFVKNYSEVNMELFAELAEERARPEPSRDFALEEELLDDLKQNQKKVLHHGNRADAIVKGMLEHSRRSNGIREISNLNELTREYTGLARQSFLVRNPDFPVEVHLSLGKDLPELAMVPGDIGRAIYNLVDNALEAMKEKGEKSGEYYPTIQVSTHYRENRILFIVKDNGAGIPKADLDRVFQPFFTTRDAGTGLGLSLAYDIVTKGHGGNLAVESVEGEFTEFTIALPVLLK